MHVSGCCVGRIRSMADTGEAPKPGDQPANIPETTTLLWQRAARSFCLCRSGDSLNPAQSQNLFAGSPAKVVSRMLVAADCQSARSRAGWSTPGSTESFNFTISEGLPRLSLLRASGVMSRCMAGFSSDSDLSRQSESRRRTRRVRLGSARPSARLSEVLRCLEIRAESFVPILPVS